MSSLSNLNKTRQKRARAVLKHGGIPQAIENGALARRLDLTLSEALVLGLWQLGVRKFVAIFGHGSTDLAEVMRIYEAEGLLETFNVRNEVEAAHVATALRWTYGEQAAVITSIGPGALQAMAGSLAAASNGVGVWHIYGDETTRDEGPNMQQIPKPEQGLFLKLLSTMGEAYSLHTPQALPQALARGFVSTHRPAGAGPFYLLLPLNTQPQVMKNFNLLALPQPVPLVLPPAQDETLLHEAARWLKQARRVVVKVGGGGRHLGPLLADFLEAVDGMLVHTPGAGGVLPYGHPRNMTVGGSKGSLCGNFAMEGADLLVAIGTRAVCQSDSSRTAYPKVKRVIHLSGGFHEATHYRHGLALVGDAGGTLKNLLPLLGAQAHKNSSWLKACAAQKEKWQRFKQARYDQPTLFDETWGREVLTQPAAIFAASRFVNSVGGVKYFDAGDVQANGFQVVEDDTPFQTFTETGASYMGFATSALVAGGLAKEPRFAVAFTGDGSFMMNPQTLIDAVEHRVHACILLMDNRAMGAIASLQKAQYAHTYKTHDSVVVDYVRMASAVRGVKAIFGGWSVASLKAALKKAHAYNGLSLIHLPVYFGENPLGGLGAFGRWNVGNWCEDVQEMRQEIGL